ncbi:MAG TPA: potassium/proton antiporter [Mycobacteriales bacterium]|nr:potassium/proton antiporter [Mycobacteriales bacterium]
MTVERLEVALLVGAVVVLVAAVAVRWSTRVGLPSLLVYLALGIALGQGAGLRVGDPVLAEALGFAALVVILAEGGLTTRWSSVRSAMPLGVALATVGVAVSIVVVALAARYLLWQPWRNALLLGAVLASTDAAAVFATLRRLPLRPRLVRVLEAESGLNDAPAVILVVLLSSPSWETAAPLGLVGLVAFELALGAAVGVAIGAAGGWLLPRAALPAAGLYPLAALAFTVLAYAVAALAHASGFLAVYVAAVVLGNVPMPHRRATLGFAQALAWLAQIGLFVLLGLLVTPERLGAAVLPALAVAVVLLLAARPLSVLASAALFRLPWSEQAFLSWAGLRGAVPIVLATIPVAAGIDGADRLFDVVFVLVVILTLIQGPGLATIARRLGVAAPAEPVEVEVESAPLEDLGADLIQLRIPAQSKLHGVEVGELRLPTGAAVTLVVRDGRSFVPELTTGLRAGDELLVVATSECRPAVEQRLRAVSRRGRLAAWLGERGEETAGW